MPVPRDSGNPESVSVALVTEFQTEPEADILERLLEYGVRVRREVRPDGYGRVRKLEVVSRRLPGASRRDFGREKTRHTFRQGRIIGTCQRRNKPDFTAAELLQAGAGEPVSSKRNDPPDEPVAFRRALPACLSVSALDASC